MLRLFQSSLDPNKLAMTFKGLLTGLIPVTVIVFASLGIGIGSEELTSFVAQLTGIIAAAMTLYGLSRKLFLWIQKLLKKLKEE